MITIYSTLRSFKESNFEDLQRKSIDNWLSLTPKPEIVILGNDYGSKELCQEKNLIHIPEVPSSKSNAPYLDSFIKHAEDVASNNIMLIISGDIIIDQTTIEATKSIKNQLNEFCVCARKLEIVIENDGSYSKYGWHLWQAGDYFLHTKGLFDNVPKYIIGRCALDNWMYRFCISKNCLVDASKTINVYHQHHDTRRSIQWSQEREYNTELYMNNLIDMPKWIDHPCYNKDKFLNVDISYANYLMQKDYSLIDNVTFERDW